MSENSHLTLNQFRQGLQTSKDYVDNGYANNIYFISSKIWNLKKGLETSLGGIISPEDAISNSQNINLPLAYAKDKGFSNVILENGIYTFGSASNLDTNITIPSNINLDLNNSELYRHSSSFPWYNLIKFNGTQNSSIQLASYYLYNIDNNIRMIDDIATTPPPRFLGELGNVNNTLYINRSGSFEILN